MIHQTAIVHPRAEIDPSCEIGPYCIVGPGVKMSKNNKLLSHVIIEGNTSLDEGNTIFPFAVLGGVPQDLKYRGEPTQLLIGKHNTIRESVTLNLGTVQGGGVTKLGDHNLLMAYVHLGHDCNVGNHCILANQVGLAGHVIVDDYANVGGMVGVGQFVRVGSHTYITGQSGVEKSVPPYCIVIGSRPCEIRGANIVGMRRKGFSAEVITKVNEAIKLWTRSEVPKEQCLLEIESQFGEIAEIRGFIDFIKSSQQGCVK